MSCSSRNFGFWSTLWTSCKEVRSSFCCTLPSQLRLGAGGPAEEEPLPNRVGPKNHPLLLLVRFDPSVQFLRHGGPPILPLRPACPLRARGALKDFYPTAAEPSRSQFFFDPNCVLIFPESHPLRSTFYQRVSSPSNCQLCFLIKIFSDTPGVAIF